MKAQHSGHRHIFSVCAVTQITRRARSWRSQVMGDYPIYPAGRERMNEDLRMADAREG